MQVYFDVKSFTAKPVNISRASLHHSQLLYETQNIAKMPLTHEEKIRAYQLIKEVK